MAKVSIGLDGMAEGTAAKARLKAGEERDRERRLKWFREARLGMLVVYGAFSTQERAELIMFWDRIPKRKYERMAANLKPKPGAAREWAAVAKKAGMKYAVMMAKHSDGYALWDSKITKFNSMRVGPRRELVREFVEACRAEGLKVGLYYNLNDWYYPDAARAAKSETARRRYLDLVQGLVRELMTNYGKIDILWYDFPAPLKTPEAWESAKTNAMVRKLQPDILINNRSMLPEDYDTPEGEIRAAKPGRMGESCLPLTGHGIWGCRREPAGDWPRARKIIDWLRIATAGAGNLLLEFPPEPDGSANELVRREFLAAGKWIKKNAEAVYGNMDRVERDVHFHPWVPYGKWTLKGNTGYFWCQHWPGKELHIVDVKTPVKRVTYLATGKRVRFAWKRGLLVLKGLPAKNPDRVAQTTVFKVEFAGAPRRTVNMGLVWSTPEK